MPAVYTYTVRIESGASLSPAVNIQGLVPVRIQTPSALDGTLMTFEASSDKGASFGQLWDPLGAGSEYQLAIGVSKSIPLKPTDFMGIDQIKLRTGTAASPTVQSAARTLLLVCAQLTP